MLQSIKQQLGNYIWDREVTTLGYWQQKLVLFMQIMVMVWRDLAGGMLTLRAMSLVYTTLLSLVPLLAVSFSVLKGFGVHNQLEPALLNFLQPLGDKSIEITANIVGFVENIKIGVLGALGLVLLIYTVISLVQKIESAFNYTWRLSSSRNLSQRFSNYLSVVMVGPVLVFSAVGIAASLQSHSMVSAIEALPYGGDFIQLLAWLLPYLLVIIAFTLVYLLVPNTRVEFRSALYGAVVAGILWRLTGDLFASFAAGSTSYTAIYSGFAILLLFMIWLYLGWMILLIGASIAYYHQYPHRLQQHPQVDRISAVLRESLALQLMLQIGRAHYQADSVAASQHSLVQRLQVPEAMILRMLKTLAECGLIVEIADDNTRYLPARDIEQISLIDIVDAARRGKDQGMLAQLAAEPAVSRIQQDIDDGLRHALAERNLKQLVVSAPA
ncbi:MAG: YihY/virulence factor BrkB family protein [Gammaproteobacteria bacterium]|nr:YihY/virulence factor BrkB family protein [Gammaproteobacteria bacterium]